MEVRVRLMGVLKARSPAGNRLDLPDGATVVQALERLGLSADGVHTVMVNGSLERNRLRPLRPADELTLLAPLGGG
jgi:sulfur carrier protein ThiS